MRGRLIEAGVGEVEVFRYDTSGLRDIGRLGLDLAAAIRSAGCEVNLVGYSMGGLVVRSAIASANDLPVRRAAFLHTPHGGSIMAHLLPFTGIRQMRPGGEFMRRLDAQRWEIPTFVVWCPGDLVVVPGHNARWGMAQEEMRCDVPAHIWPLFSRRIHLAVARFLLAS